MPTPSNQPTISIDTIYRIHRKRDADEDAPRCLRVDYMIGLDHWQSEFICVEHTG